MTLTSPTPRSRAGTLELQESGHCHWLVQDSAFPPSDARHLVASLNETPDRDIEVVWMRADHPFRTRYRTLGEVMHDLTSLRFLSSSSRKPVEIPHHPPLPS